MESQQNSLVSVLVFRCIYPSLARQVVQPVRDQLALSCAGEIMIKRLHLRLRVGLALPGEVADQLFFLRVDAG